MYVSFHIFFQADLETDIFGYLIAAAVSWHDFLISLGMANFFFRIIESIQMK